jgi:hypothetical protein
MSLYAPWVDQARRDPRCVSLQLPSDWGADKFQGLPYFFVGERPRLSSA